MQAEYGQGYGVQNHGASSYGYGYGGNHWGNYAAARNTTQRYTPGASLGYGGFGYGGSYGGASRHYGYGANYGFMNAETGHHPSYLQGPNCYYLDHASRGMSNTVSQVPHMPEDPEGVTGGYGPRYGHNRASAYEGWGYGYGYGGGSLGGLNYPQRGNSIYRSTYGLTGSAVGAGFGGRGYGYGYGYQGFGNQAAIQDVGSFEELTAQGF